MVAGASTTQAAVRGGSPRRSLLPTTAQAGAVAGVLLAVFTALVLIGGRAKGIAAAVATFGFPAMGLIYVPLAALAALRSTGRLRATWLMMTLGWTCMALGDLIWSYYKHVLGTVPFPSWADVAYLSYVPFICAGLLLFPGTQSWLDRSRMVLDGLLVTCSFFLISWVTVMRSAWRAGGDSSQLDFAISLAYPAGDLLIVTLAFLILVRVPSGMRTATTILVVGLACSAVGNGVWAYLGDPEAYKVGAVADIFYAANYLLIVVALIAAHHARPRGVVTSTSPRWLSLWLPLVPVALAAVFVATADADVVTEAPVVVTGSVLLLATLFRQFTQSADLVRREHEVRHLADRLTEELDSASRYVDSILPLDVAEPIAICSRYLPARAVGGDSFGYEWIADDHLIVYLIDVSGHGVKPALLSVSVHNLLRSGGLTRDTLLAPDRVLAELNGRFGMDNHDEHYFTMWYGVYEMSSGLLRYANAGHPPPLVLTAGRITAELDGASMPVGMFPDTEFTAHAYSVPAGARILLYSDGVLDDPPRMADFRGLCAELVGDPSGELDDLVTRLPPSEDDCSLVLLTFPLAGVHAGAA